MTDAAIIAASYAAERNYSHNPDDVIDASNAVGAWGTAKESTTKLVDISGNGNIADIHGAMPTEGFIQGRRYDGVDDYLDCGDDSRLKTSGPMSIKALLFKNANEWQVIGMSSSINTANGFALLVTDIGKIRFWLGNGEINIADIYSDSVISNNVYTCVEAKYDKSTVSLYINGVKQIETANTTDDIGNNSYLKIGGNDTWFIDGNVAFLELSDKYSNDNSAKQFFNTLARLPFWSVNYIDYPNNVIEYTDNLPYSSSIISSGTFKVNDDKLQCVSAGTITYSASYDFDGSEYIKVEIGGVEYAGTGTITQGNTTVSVAQGSNKVTIEAGTGDAIDSIMVQFREEV